jgi:hypothetical protein
VIANRFSGEANPNYEETIQQLIEETLDKLTG